jgi:hypothetical protein
MNQASCRPVGVQSDFFLSCWLFCVRVSDFSPVYIFYPSKRRHFLPATSHSGLLPSIHSIVKPSLRQSRGGIVHANNVLITSSCIPSKLYSLRLSKSLLPSVISSFCRPRRAGARRSFGTTENQTFRIDSTDIINQNDKDDENDAIGVICIGGLHAHGG